MTGLSDALSSHVPAMSNEMAAGLAMGGLTMAVYGCRKWSQAKNTSDKLKAAGFALVGVCSAGLGALGALSNLSQYFYPATKTLATNACRNLLREGVSHEDLRVYSADSALGEFIPPMSDDRYSNLQGSYVQDRETYLYCSADLTTNGKAFLTGAGHTGNSLRFHSYVPDGIFQRVYAKVNLHG